MARPAMQEDLDEVRGFVSRSSLIEQDRTQGKTPVSVEQIGDDRPSWFGTGLVAVGGSAVVPLTLNGEAGGPSLYRKVPVVVCYAEAEMEIPTRAWGPRTPTTMVALTNHGTFTLDWDGSRWSVTVTNDTAARRGFRVVNMGYR
jgi:hypothetical protein